ncbi:photosynthetic complex putative assembly protein PuhB [Sphingomonas glacialis]|uniref:PH domain-containing protein n=1 Tax=Sphingomonas glacialis TaxID=658225 RepID=A0A502FTF6_9SPHN|nr:photosynthetic complex putative assembly protein PuhB [Sphingomonas glacialis]TPG52887.1 PH domain-containing protein [Sphingomonas glacialis]
MTEHDYEPIPGLPGLLPPGERIVWQGAPDWRVLARYAYHTRAVTAYFGVLGAWAVIAAVARGIRGPGDLSGVALTAMFGIIAVGLLRALAWGAARTSLYTLTNRRVVLRIGVAFPKCINLPLAMIGTVGLAVNPDQSGDIPLALTGERRLGFLALWPHARPWHVAAAQPMLRALPDAAHVASLIARTCLEVQPSGQVTQPVSPAAPANGFGQAVAA